MKPIILSLFMAFFAFTSLIAQCPLGLSGPTINDPIDYGVSCSNFLANEMLVCQELQEYLIVNNLIVGETYCFENYFAPSSIYTVYDDLNGSPIGFASEGVCVTATATTLYVQLNPGNCSSSSSCVYTWMNCPTCPPPTCGCTNPSANNYDPSAELDDNSCTYYATVELTCGDVFTDDGGVDGDYTLETVFGVDLGTVTIICPETAGEIVVVEFAEFYLSYYQDDLLTVYNGNSTNAPPILSPTGSTDWDYDNLGVSTPYNEGSLTDYPIYGDNPTGCLTFFWNPDLSSSTWATFPGWVANVDCIVPQTGCMDACDSNFDPNATIADNTACAGDNTGPCGCTDPTVCNYDSSALYDDGSCIYTTCPDACSAYSFLIQPNTGNPIESYSITHLNTGQVLASGSVNFSEITYDFVYICDLPDGCYQVSVDGYNSSWILFDPVGNVFQEGGNEETFFNTGIDNKLGCTDPSACNYDSDANCEDGSCEYGYFTCPEPCEAYKMRMRSYSTSWPTWWDNQYTIVNNSTGDTIGVGGIVNVQGFNYVEEDFFCELADGCYSITVDGGTDVGALVQWAFYNSSLEILAEGFAYDSDEFIIGNTYNTCDSPCSAYTIEMSDENGDGWNGASYNITDNAGNTVASGDLDNADYVTSDNSGIDYICNLSDGCYNISIEGLGPDNDISWNLLDPGGEILVSTYSFISNFAVGTEIGGCTDPSACDYNPNATCGTGCAYGAIGCTNANACNYNPGAGCDDGSCVFPDCLGECDGTTTGTNIVGTPCDDGNLQTVNDVYDNNCNCTGTPPCDYNFTPNTLYSNNCYLQTTLNGEYCSSYPNTNLTSNTGNVGLEFSVVQLIQGNTYDLSIFVSCSFGNGNHEAWIDYNQNGEYEESESITSGTDSGTFSFTLPANAPIGITTIRVSATDYLNSNACSGEDEDSFLVNIIADTPSACQLDCSCTGCLDICDANFDPLANVHDSDLCAGVNVCACTNPWSCNYDPTAVYDLGCDPTPSVECEDPCNTFYVSANNTYINSQAYFSISDANNGYIIASGYGSQAICALPDGCYELFGNDGIDSFITITDADGNSIISYGASLFSVGNTCADPTACNYNPDSNCPSNNDCIYETNANCNNNICVAPGITEWDESTCSCEIVEAIVSGCMDPMACNFNTNANCDNSSCIYETVCNNDICIGLGITQWDNNTCSCELVQTPILGCFDINACNFDANANCDDNNCIYETSCNDDICTAPGITQWNDNTCNCEVVEATVLGCTNPTASNYNSNANCEDGSCVNCEDVGTACNDGNVWTFNDVYNGSCECVGETYCGTFNQNWGNAFPDGTGPIGSLQSPSMSGEFCSSFDATFTNFQDRVSELSVVEVMQGSTYELYSVYNCFAVPSCAFYISAWIDFNQDLVFDDSEKVVDFGPVSDFSGPFDVSIPSDALPGLTGMRLVMSNQPAEPCGLVQDIENWLINVNDPENVEPCQLDCSCSGCTDVCDVNFDPLANIGDASSCAEAEIDYCTACLDPCDSNYEPTALYNDYGLCAGDDVCGCTDETACNFDPNALSEDYSCDYGQAACGGNCVYYLTLIGPYSFDPLPLASYSITNVVTGEVFASGNVILNPGNLPSGVVFFCDIPDGCYQFESSVSSTRLYAPNGTTIFNNNAFSYSNPYFSIGEADAYCNDPTACNYNPNATVCVDNTTCIFESTCNDPTACNYFPNSNCADNTTCIYETTCNNDICTAPGTTQWNENTCSCEIVEYTISGCLDPTACNYNANANCVDDAFCLYGTDCVNEDCIFPGSPPAVCNLDYGTPCGEEYQNEYGYPYTNQFGGNLPLLSMSFEGENSSSIDFDYCEQSDYAALLPTIEMAAGETYSIDLSFDFTLCGTENDYYYYYLYSYYNFGVGIWIDFNQDNFYDETELIQSTVGQLTPFELNFDFTVPSNAVPGLTGFRLILAEDYSSATALSTGCLDQYLWYGFLNLFVSIDETPNVGCIDPNACNYNPISTGFIPCHYGEDYCETNDCEAIEGNCYSCETFAFGYDPNDSSISYDYVLTNLNTGEIVLETSTTNPDLNNDSNLYQNYLCNFQEGCYAVVVIHSWESTSSWVSPYWELSGPNGNFIENSYDTDTTYFVYGDVGTLGCTDINACNFDPTATCGDNSCTYEDDCTNYCETNPDECGCTDANACNYDSAATIDDGSCITDPITGCMDPTACNYDETACIDATCIYEIACEEFDPCTFGAVFTWNPESCACEAAGIVLDGCTDPAACNYNEAANCDDSSCLYENPCPEESFSLAAKILLEGPYIGGGMMNSGLGDLMPLEQPYNVPPYNHTGTETASTIPTNAVDWVIVEMRSGIPANNTQNTIVVETKAGFLIDNGDILDIDGISTLTFENLTAGENYHICIRHRNHLDVLSATPVIANTTMTYDFTTAENQAFGLGQLKEIEANIFGLYAGDYTQEGVIQTTDYDLWFALPASLNTYEITDGTLDGVVQNTDFDKWFNNKAKLGISEVRFD